MYYTIIAERSKIKEIETERKKSHRTQNCKLFEPTMALPAIAPAIQKVFLEKYLSFSVFF